MRLKFKRIIIALIIIFITIFLALFARETLQEKSKTNNSSVNTNITDIFTNNSQIELEEAYVTKVIDGDTIWALINGNEEKIRLIGIDCPEYTKEIEAYGKEATEFTTEKLLNKTIYLQKDITNTLPAPSAEEKKLNSPSDYNGRTEETEPVLLRPMIKIPSQQKQQNLQPAVNKQTPSSKTQPVKNIQNNKNIKQENKQEQDTEKHVPYYDWNLKNIYLQKIGKLSMLNL